MVEKFPAPHVDESNSNAKSLLDPVRSSKAAKGVALAGLLAAAGMSAPACAEESVREMPQTPAARLQEISRIAETDPARAMGLFDSQLFGQPGGRQFVRRIIKELVIKDPKPQFLRMKSTGMNQSSPAVSSRASHHFSLLKNWTQSKWLKQ